MYVENSTRTKPVYLSPQPQGVLSRELSLAASCGSGSALVMRRPSTHIITKSWWRYKTPSAEPCRSLACRGSSSGVTVSPPLSRGVRQHSLRKDHRFHRPGSNLGPLCYEADVNTLRPRCTLLSYAKCSGLRLGSAVATEAAVARPQISTAQYYKEKIMN